MTCQHLRVVVVSPLSWQWTASGPKARGHCIDCGFEGMLLTEERIHNLSAGSLRWNTDNVTETGSISVDPLVGRVDLVEEVRAKKP
jgi:hypothetical protein